MVMSAAHCKSYIKEKNFDELQKNFKIITDNISNNIEKTLYRLNQKEKIFESIILSSGRKTSKGNDFRNLFWWKIKVKEGCLKEKYAKYTNILLTPYKCNYDENIEIKLGTCNEFPHIDSETGNFHPEFDLCEWINTNNKKTNIMLGQAVLVKNLSPKLSLRNKKDFNDNELLKYSDKLIVPKNCYFPRLEKIDNETYNVEFLLKGLLSNVLKEEIFSNINWSNNYQ